jgi:hypothetical protein
MMGKWLEWQECQQFTFDSAGSVVDFLPRGEREVLIRCLFMMGK